MSEVAIRVANLGKRYRLNHQAGAGGYRTLREDLMAMPRRWIARSKASNASSEEFWALREVSFEVKQGEVLGVVGRNGAGKSTLLKILSRIVEPSTGQIDIFGRIGSLLEVGTGFHPELTGRENIYLSGAILGMRRSQVSRRFDEIVAFADVDRFVDTPCKHYSSGMYARLGFAVAAHLDTDILVVDEVLAVGDAEFQKRCLSKMQSLAGSSGRTVLFVSHNSAAIRQLCSKAIYFKAGQLVAEGLVNDIMQIYSSDQSIGQVEFKRVLGIEALCGIESVRINGTRSGDGISFAFGTPIELLIGINVNKFVRTAQIGVRITTSDGSPILTTSNFDAARVTSSLQIGRYLYRVVLPPLLAPGDYRLLVAAVDPKREVYDVVDGKIGFSIDRVGSLSMDLNDGRLGSFELVIPWQVEPVT